MTAPSGPAADLSFIPGALHRHRGPDRLITEPLTWPAAALFVDISGFTTLTEALAAHGPTGLEQLRTLLNSYFSPLSRIVDSLGGSIVRFEGDAVTAVFDSDENTDALRAVACAASLRRLAAEGTARSSAAGPIVIQTKIGVAIGEGVSALAHKEDRLQPVFGGSAIIGAAAAESRARPGQVVLGPGVADVIGSPIDVSEPDSDGYTRLGQHEIPTESAPREAGETVDPLLIVHPTVLSRIGLADGLIDEYRPATVLFAGLTGPDDRAMTVEDVAAAITTIAPVVHDLDGEIMTAIVGDKGSSLLLSFGAPSATDQSPSRAVQTAASISRLVGARIGIATGSMFCGMIGGPERAEYTVIGDTANTAARLMQIAIVGEVLVDQTTRLLLDTQTTFGPTRRLEVKGKVEVVECAPLKGEGEQVRRASHSDHLIGRRRERSRLHELMSRASAGRGGSALLHGPGGIGKSRLLLDLVNEAPTVLSARFKPTDRSTPYGGLHSLFRRAIGLPVDLQPSTDAARAGLGQLLPDAPPDRAQLIMPLVGAMADPTDEVQLITSNEHGSDLIRALAVDVIQALAENGPVLVAIDDVHRADRETIQLFDQLNRVLPSLRAAAVYTSRSADMLAADEQIDVSELGETESLRLAAEMVGPEDAAGLVRFSGGNPLALSLAADGWNQSEDRRALPLTALALARIDSLPAHHRNWFRRAAAFVNGFDRNLAESMLGPGSLDELVNLGLFEPSLSTTGALYTTRHSILREAVYDTLLPGQRRELHLEIGERLEAQPGEVDVFELAYHFGETDAADKQRTYFTQATDMAEEAFSFGLATEWAERLLPLLPDAAQPALHLRLGRWYTFLGMTDQAEQALLDAGRGVLAVQSQALSWRARLASRAGLGNTVELLLAEADRLAQRSANREAIIERTLVEAESARSGANQQAMLHAGKHLLDIADGIPLIEARAHHAIGAASIVGGDGQAARRSYLTAIDMAAAAGDLVLASEIRSDLAETYFFDNRLAIALDELSRAGAEAEATGYRRGVSAVAANEAMIRSGLGDTEGAMALIAISASRLLEVGDYAWTLATVPLPAKLFIVRGAPQVARDLLSTTVRLARQADQPETEAHSTHVLARALAALGDHAEASAMNRQAGALANEIGYGQLLPDIAVLDARIDGARGNVDAALARLDALAEDAPPPLLAQIAYERWRTAPTNGRRAAAIDAYKPMHAETPTAQTARRLTALTGDGHRPPDVPPNQRRGPEPTAEFFLDLVATVEAEMDRLATAADHS